MSMAPKQKKNVVVCFVRGGTPSPAAQIYQQAGRGWGEKKKNVIVPTIPARRDYRLRGQLAADEHFELRQALGAVG